MSSDREAWANAQSWRARGLAVIRVLNGRPTCISRAVLGAEPATHERADLGLCCLVGGAGRWHSSVKSGGKRPGKRTCRTIGGNDEARCEPVRRLACAVRSADGFGANQL